MDEMTIDQKLVYDKQLDKIFGFAETGEHGEVCEPQKAANRMLCFLLRGLSSSYAIPVGYFFTYCLKGAELLRMMLDVLSEVGSLGFSVIHIVADNHQTNTAMFKALGNGELLHKIPHPCNTIRPLFLSFDPNHIIKNLRSILLERKMTDGYECIDGGYYMKILLDIQKNILIKPVRFLTRAHVFPTNLEKMKVKRARDIFLPVVIGTLNFLKDNPFCHKDASLFSGCGATVMLMENINKWYELQDISNWNEHLFSILPNKRPFSEINEERLNWLQLDFLLYMESMKKECSNMKMQFLTKETYNALYLTTLSTVDVVKYLLNTVKFRYVLTRRFNSDPIESFFSCIRQFNGGNDKLDARSASLTTQMILKVGILQAAQNGNAPCSSSSSKLLPVMTETNCNVEDEVCKLHDSSLSILQKLQSLTQDCSVLCTIENASLAVISGYLIRVLEEKVACYECLEILNHPASNGALFGLISNQDRGQLRYPRPGLVGVIRILTDFFDDVLTYTNPCQAGLKVKLVKVILPYLKNCPVLWCKANTDGAQSNHNNRMCNIIATKFVSPFLTNWTGQLSQTVEKVLRLHHKPISRKILKV
ncbi:uncharacterized protein LOC111632058 [Centruroides sculpturatus]|uniref:uncharacterized protein LOC111632058 n=1 Tax=Centruroides sculpturatus TaxID=218467 RepID=UPI000C6D407D|nr:uncharacterized protein LOC111632058 [Centruroides sculpturatus]